MSSYKRCNIAKTGQQIFELFVGNNKFFRISLLKSIKCKVVSTLVISIVFFYSCAEDMSNCGIMGFYAFSTLNGSIPERHKKLYLYTDEKKPFCSTHYSVTIG